MIAATHENLPGCQAVLIRWPNSTRIKTHVEAVQSAYEAKSALLLDVSKSLIESVCITILEEHGKTVAPDVTLEHLLKNTQEAYRYQKTAFLTEARGGE